MVLPHGWLSFTNICDITFQKVVTLLEESKSQTHTLVLKIGAHQNMAPQSINDFIVVKNFAPHQSISNGTFLTGR